MERGEVVGVDATVTDTAILSPCDSGLLDDAVRVMVRLLKEARWLGDVAFHNHQRKAKRRRVAILYARSNARRQPLYTSLLEVTRATLAYLDDASQRDVQYGHKLTLSSGASGLALDVIVEDGNPADSGCLMPLLQRRPH